MKYYLWVLGCAMNYSDAERIGSVLDLLGYKKTEEEESADLIITVACSVRQKAIDRIYGKSRTWQKAKKKRPLTTILSGCVLADDKKKMRESFDLIFDIKNIDALIEFLGKTRKEKDKIDDYFSIHPKYESDFEAYVPIMTGCNNFCTYCAVPYTRGREESRKPEEILAEVKDLVKSGYKEITLLGQNVNSYKYGFADLLKELDKIKGDYRIYFYSNHPKDMSDELLVLLPKLKHFPKYIHLPLQSGSNRVLKAMNRHYTKESYLKLVEKIKEIVPDVTITTDIIVGFSGETKKEFQETAEVMRGVGYGMAFLSEYSKRVGTAAAKLKDNVAKAEKTRRKEELTKILRDYLEAENKKLVGTTLRVLINCKKNGKYYGRTDSYKVVEIPEDTKTDLIGRFCEVKITRSTAWKLVGLV